MNARTAAKTFVGILLVLLGVILGARCLFPAMGGGKPVLTRAQLFEVEVRLALVREGQRASVLVRQGKHLEAALLLVELAGAEKLLLKDAGKGGEPSEPTLTEQVALMQFTVIHKDDAYREFLRIVYPTWRPSRDPTIRDDHGENRGGGNVAICRCLHKHRR